MNVICHVAIEDDWEMSRGFGEYEVSTRGVHLDEVYIRATTPERVDEVVHARYADLSLPLLRIDLSVDGLERAGVSVEWLGDVPRVRGAIPMTPDVVLREEPVAP